MITIKTLEIPEKISFHVFISNLKLENVKTDLTLLFDTIKDNKEKLKQKYLSKLYKNLKLLQEKK